jgi:thiamine biosynthesis lipoprotein
LFKRALRRSNSIPIALCLCALLRAQDPVRVEAADEAMGGTFSVAVYGGNRTQLDAAVAAAFQELHRLDRLLSNYDPGSEWSNVNRNAAERPVSASRELFHVLEDCLRYSRESEGAFDITVGPLMKLWGFYKGEGMLPRDGEVARVIERVGHRHVLLDREGATVRFDRYGVELDPGGIGKGYAVDRMIEVLKARGVNIALVSAAGSSIYGMGAPPDSPPGWPITIREPGDERRTAGTVFLKDMSLSTSGSYEKFFWAAGRRYSHIMDPRTGYPAQGASSVSVLAPRTLDSEAWAKPYFINGRTWTVKHKPAKFRVFYCDDVKGQACTWIP